uniref:uncharacterized protein LOC105350994 n=1 Tax=Fragaria vesca subsp. vesca TaxID=101020 RepID=UPI0005CB667B|nr:PREDICTED: uncharacterized protein LOC105350994 [Fragaria vesca subsp. vesca]
MEILNLNSQTLLSLTPPAMETRRNHPQQEERPLDLAGDNIKEEGNSETRTIWAGEEKAEATVTTSQEKAEANVTPAHLQYTANRHCPNCGRNIYTKPYCPRLSCRFSSDPTPALPMRPASEIKTNSELESHPKLESDRVSLFAFFTRKDLDRLIDLSIRKNVFA